MSEEEKKAIEDLKNIVTDLEDTEDGAIISLQQEEIDSLKILAELIERQQKEIEKEHENWKKLLHEYGVKCQEIKELSEKLTEKICKGVEEEILEEYRQTIISKDKEIEELNVEILELTNQRTEGFLENDRLKNEIEKLKEYKYMYEDLCK